MYVHRYLEQTLNVFTQPLVRESCTHLFKICTATFGILEACDETIACYKSLQGRMQMEKPVTFSRTAFWISIIAKVLIITAKWTLVFMAIDRFPSLLLQTKVTKHVIVDPQLQSLKSTPSHLAGQYSHHLITIFSLALGIPTTVRNLYETSLTAKTWAVYYFPKTSSKSHIQSSASQSYKNSNWGLPYRVGNSWLNPLTYHWRNSLSVFWISSKS